MKTNWYLRHCAISPFPLAPPPADGPHFFDPLAAKVAEFRVFVGGMLSGWGGGEQGGDKAKEEGTEAREEEEEDKIRDDRDKAVRTAEQGEFDGDGHAGGVRWDGEDGEGVEQCSEHKMRTGAVVEVREDGSGMINGRTRGERTGASRGDRGEWSEGFVCGGSDG